MSLRQSRRPIYLRQRIAPLALEQYAYQFREDDGTETTASFIGALNAPLVHDAGPLRLRLQVNATGNPSVGRFRLQYRVNGGAWRYANPEGI